MNKDVRSELGSHNISAGVGTRVQREKLVERIGALCAAQRRKKQQKRRRRKQ